jgi:hypothetical protein
VVKPQEQLGGLQGVESCVSRDGLFVYSGASDWSHLWMFQFSRDQITGKLTPLTPASFMVDSISIAPSKIFITQADNFVYLLGNNNSSIAQFSRDLITGLLTPLSPLSIDISADWSGITKGCISLTHNTLYILANDTNGHVYILQFNSNLTTGLLTYVGATPIQDNSSSWYFPVEIVIDPTGSFIYVPGEGDIVSHLGVWSINPSNGFLTKVFILDGVVDGAQSSVMSKDGLNLYIGATIGSQSIIYQFSLNNTTGEPSALSTPFFTSEAPYLYNPTEGFTSADGNNVYFLNINYGECYSIIELHRN